MLEFQGELLNKDGQVEAEVAGQLDITEESPTQYGDWRGACQTTSGEWAHGMGQQGFILRLSDGRQAPVHIKNINWSPGRATSLVLEGLAAFSK